MPDSPDRAALAETLPTAAERPSGENTNAEGLEALVKRRIDERTHGRIRDLRVEGENDAMVVLGRAERYYLVQLALAAAQEILAPRGVRMKVAVCPPSSPRQR